MAIVYLSHPVFVCVCVYVCERALVCVCVYIYPNPPPREGSDSRSVFKYLNSEFSFSQSGYPNRIKEFSLPFYLPIAWGSR